MAIGRPVSLTSNVASKTISVTATASQTLFTVTGGYRINQVAVFRNGVRLADGSDYTARDGATVTLLSPAALNDVLEFQIFDDFRVADAIQTASAEQTINGNLTVTGSITGVTSVTGAMIGIQSAGVNVGAAKTLNFIGLVIHSLLMVKPLMLASLEEAVAVDLELPSIMQMVLLLLSVILIEQPQ